MSLATSGGNEVGVCSLFYIYDEHMLSFAVASNIETMHIKYIMKNNTVAGNIFLETLEIDKIKGVQFFGEFLELKDEKLKQRYFKKFPYALDLNPKLWQIKVTSFKMTDNELGFGEKLIWP